MNKLKTNEKIIIQGDFYKNFWLIPMAMGLISVIVWFFIIPDVAGVNSTEFDVCSIVCPAFIIISLIILFYANGCSITITDKRVYGKATFGKRVDLPLDSISAVSSKAFLSCICVSTSSGTVSFCLAKNYAELHKEINDLLITRQNKTDAFYSNSSSDELKKLKSLLDEKIITQEEFDAKKKELLGL